MYNKASALLKRMEEDERIKPYIITYTTFLNILARSTNSTKEAKIAETILNMLEKSQDAKMVPNNYLFDAVIKNCAFLPSKANKQTKRHALVVAVTTLGKIQASKYVKPSALTYSAFFSAIAKLTSGK